MVKESRKEKINAPENSVQSIVDRVKELRTKPQSEKIREEIKRLIVLWAEKSKFKE